MAFYTTYSMNAQTASPSAQPFTAGRAMKPAAARIGRRAALPR